MEEIRTFLNSEAGLALQGLLLVAFADFATGTLAALRDGTFALEAIGAWIRKHVAGRVGPIGLLLFLSYYGGAAGLAFGIGAATLAATYIAETVASVFGNIKPPKAADVKDNSKAAALNPIPQD